MMKVLCVVAIMFSLCAADVYLHNPRGGNNRLDEANRNRNNGNRLFDSQNNNRGGSNVGKLYYYSGSILTVEWTNQHGCGTNPNVDCQLILQYMCSDSNPDLRDGTTTGTIPSSPDDCFDGDCSKDMRYGMHETFEYYTQCTKRERNKGLFAASRQINRNTAIGTRQNNNGQRRGYECPEERDYYPYWHPSPWKDIAVLASTASRCAMYKAESQNVKAKGLCFHKNNDTILPEYNDPAKCNNRSQSEPGEWREVGAHGLAPPFCGLAPWSRDNHNGNTIGGFSSQYNWTIPDIVADRCVLRLRYNITTADYNAWDPAVNASLNDKAGLKIGLKGGYPLKDDPTVDFGAGVDLKLSVDTSQFGRTFQDRSHIFEIKRRPETVSNDTVIYNLNVRGKRGNIVQTYPGTEYDFVPQRLQLNNVGTMVHIQWTGSNTNPNNNAGQGSAGTDRHNIVQFPDAAANIPSSLANSAMLGDKASSAAFLGLFSGENSELDEASPYFDLGLVTPPADGVYHYGSTRNNNFSNRGQKAALIVTEYQSVSLTVTESGAKVEIPGVAMLTIQENALSSDTTVAVAQKRSTELPTQLDPPASADAISSIYEITPHGQTFAKPVLVQFPARKADGSGGNFYMVKASGPQATHWEHVEGQIQADGWVSANVTSFSYFVVVDGGNPTVAIVVGSLCGLLVIAVAAMTFYYRQNPDVWLDHKAKVFSGFSRSSARGGSGPRV